MPQTNLGRVAFKFQGDYSALTTYAKYDVVFDGESSFVSQIDNNLGNELVDGLNWKYLAKGNNLGLQGLQQDVTDLETELNYMYPSVGIAKRILLGAGTIKSRSTLNDLTNKFLDLLPNTKLLFCPHLAVKLRESGIYKYVTKLYDIGTGMIDGAQTTALNQPYLSGNIAPNEKYAIKNPNGGSAYMTHTPISFLSTDKWSVSTIVNCNTRHDFISEYLSSGSVNLKNVFKVFPYIFYNSEGLGTPGIYRNDKFGKNTVITWVYNGNGFINFYLDGIRINTFEIQGSVNFSKIFGSAFNDRGAYASIKYHCIRDIALTQQQVADEYSYLRTLFPEIESVAIGAQTWATSNCEMTCTPQGNFIPEMQAATNVEKIVNGGFDNELSWSKFPEWTISEGCAKVLTTTSSSAIYQNRPVAGRWIRCAITIENYVSGNVRFRFGSGQIGSPKSANGSYVEYIYVIDGGLSNLVGIYASLSTNLYVSSVSFEEVGWSDSTNLYNYVYANTSGTAEQKEYAAVKAAAMWCYYNNDPALGAVFGKLYNWYAVKLLQMDIDYYNAANPTATWRWRVPTSSDFTTLSTYLGGDAVAGGKMRKEGSNYWSAPNTGATNESGFSALCGGFRSAIGEYLNFLPWSVYAQITNNNSKLLISSFNGVRDLSYYVNISNIIGSYIRLIKS